MLKKPGRTVAPSRSIRPAAPASSRTSSTGPTAAIDWPRIQIPASDSGAGRLASTTEQLTRTWPASSFNAGHARKGNSRTDPEVVDPWVAIGREDVALRHGVAERDCVQRLADQERRHVVCEYLLRLQRQLR